ncbi:MAG: SPW repeat domain-containing protein [Bdellovibrionota bacterium]
MLSLKTHNVIDYVAGVFLLFVPAIFGFSEIDAARNVFLFSGIALIAYSLLTKYEYALWRVIPVSAHMSLDVLNGVLIMLAPWIFGYRDVLTPTQEVLHYVLALGVFGLVAFTQPQTDVSEVSGIDADLDVRRDRKAG